MVARRLWSVVRALCVPVLSAGLAALLLRPPLLYWLQGEGHYDREALTEWVREARVYQTLPDLAKELAELKDRYRDLEGKLLSPDPDVARRANEELRTVKPALGKKRDEIEVHLRSMCDPVTKVYPGRLPLFVTVYRLTVRFDDSLDEKPIVWDSLKPRQPNQYHVLQPVQILSRGVWVDVDYQMRVYA